MIPKFRFYASEDFTGMYNVVEIRFQDYEVVIEDDKNTSMIEVLEGNYNISKNGFPIYRYGFSEGELMQFTGQTDMDGIEIYEGDVLAYFYGGMNFIKDEDGNITIDENVPFDGYFIQEVTFEHGYFGLLQGETLVPIWNSSNKIKVLGNKYENPELLK